MRLFSPALLLYPTAYSRQITDVLEQQQKQKLQEHGQRVHYLHMLDVSNFLTITLKSQNCVICIIMRPSSLGGGRIMRRTLSVRLSVCLSVCPSVHPVIVTERHVAPPSELQ